MGIQQMLLGAGGSFGFSETISVNTNNYNVKTAAMSAGWNEISPLIATITVDGGVVVGSTSVSTAALDSGTTFPVGSSITIVNNGTIKGKGGDGTACRWVSASSGYWAANGGGEAGGTAIKTTITTTVTNNGVVAGGGGGGGFIGGYAVGGSDYGGASGGGGAGAVVGAAASLTSEIYGSLASSAAGTSTTGGAGSLYTAIQGPSGGDLGTAGQEGTYYTFGGGSVPTAGGAAGKYLDGVALTSWSGTAGVGGSA
jgi:hypothetical protein